MPGERCRAEGPRRSPRPPRHRPLSRAPPRQQAPPHPLCGLRSSYRALDFENALQHAKFVANSVNAFFEHLIGHSRSLELGEDDLAAPAARDDTRRGEKL